jgi:glycerol-3-phosphate acyltransferase PlsX
VKIAVDAMGGDFAPQAVVEGAVMAAREHGCQVILVGDREIVDKLLDGRSFPAGSVLVKHAGQVVGMDESPSLSLRRKPDSSLRLAFELVKAGEASAAISAGNSGAAMVTAMYVLRPIPGVERPAIASLVPTRTGRVVLLDAGANVDCRSRHLLQFGCMGHAMAKYALGMDVPRVGLLSNGEEEGKGNELTREAYGLLAASGINFVGNIEGGDVFAGRADVVVCDGFCGNVVLKVAEGVVSVLGERLKDEVKGSPLARFGYLFMRPALRRFKRRFDYAEYGGALLLGIDGIGLISHGKSSPRAVMNAIRTAETYARSRIVQHLRQELELHHAGAAAEAGA